MNSKLTLRLDDHLIQVAKNYSAKTGKSISRIVADMFAIIALEQQQQEDTIPSRVQALKGLLKHADISDHDYQRHLEEKHL